MPTDPPKSSRSDSSFDEVIIREARSSYFTGCFGPTVYVAAPSSTSLYRFRFSPQPHIVVSESKETRWKTLSTVLLNEQETRRFLHLIRPAPDDTNRLGSNSEPQIELRKQGQVIATYPLYSPGYLSGDADERDLSYLGTYTGSTLSLSRVFDQAYQASKKGLSQVRYVSPSRYKTVAYQARRVKEKYAWENQHALEALAKMPGYTELEQRFTIDLVRLQEDRQGVFLVASLTPKKVTRPLDTVEWYCPLAGGNGRQFLTTLAPLVDRITRNQWILRWKGEQQNREVVMRVRPNTAEMVLIDSGRELPAKRLS